MTYRWLNIILCTLALQTSLHSAESDFFDCIDDFDETEFSLSFPSQQEDIREQVLFMLSGEWVSRCLYTATKLLIADHLYDGEKSIHELALLTETHPNSLYRLLHTLSSIEIFEERDNQVFANTPQSEMLAKKSPDSLHKLALFFGEEMRQAWDQFPECVTQGIPAFNLKFGTPVFSYFKQHLDRASLFNQAMKEKSQGVVLSSIANYNFTQYQLICDVGGGNGMFIETLLNTYPLLQGTLFELPETIREIHWKNPELAKNPRCQLVEGDFFQSIPSGADAYLLKSILHDWDNEQAVTILKNCHAAMGPFSRLLIVEALLLPEDLSIYANLMDIHMMAITGGKERSFEELDTLLNKAGFDVENIYPTATEFSIIEARKSSLNHCH